MNVPQIQHLHSQSFNSEFIEFVWEFPMDKTQLIFNVSKDGSIILQENEKVGEIYKQKYMSSGIITTKNLLFQELTDLKLGVMEFLK